MHSRPSAKKKIRVGIAFLVALKKKSDGNCRMTDVLVFIGVLYVLDAGGHMWLTRRVFSGSVWSQYAM